MRKYQLRIYSKGKIEVFEHVLWHKVYLMQGGIRIKHGPKSDAGLFTMSDRTLDGVYLIETDANPTIDKNKPISKRAIKYLDTRGAGEASQD